MKQLVLLASLVLLGSARLAAAPLAPADTVAGQTQLARRLASEACQQLAAGPGAAQSPAQAQAAFEQALSQTIEKRQAAIRQVAASAQVAGAYEQLRAALSTTVAVQLIKTCPAAAQLYNQFSQTATGEDALVKSWGDELCQRLAALHTAGAFKGKTSAERIELFHREFNASLNQRGPQIMQLYGASGNSQAVVERTAGRVTEYMQQQCPATLMLLKDGK